MAEERKRKEGKARRGKREVKKPGKKTSVAEGKELAAYSVFNAEGESRLPLDGPERLNDSRWPVVGGEVTPMLEREEEGE